MSPDDPASAKREYFEIPVGFENFDNSQIEEFSSRIYDDFIKPRERKSGGIELETGSAGSSKDEVNPTGD